MGRVVAGEGLLGWRVVVGPGARGGTPETEEFHELFFERFGLVLFGFRTACGRVCERVFLMLRWNVCVLRLPTAATVAGD